ncbi:hypothetical protein RUM44_008102 [Polyplax serrata]|uniref:Lipase n=1 Tax=Polyplax serrata TaxID=468196 RepID=A0ABR1B9E8_POLSC
MKSYILIYISVIILFLHVLVLFVVVTTSDGIRLNRSNVRSNSIPDSKKETVDFCVKYGYPGEKHEVETKDHYTLTLHRIPYNGMNETADRPVVLLQHGIVLSSDQWVLRGREDLVFLLSDQGYDVWMSNTRGTAYSKHPLYSKDDYKFWDYSLNELGNYDLPAIIDYILNVTGKPQMTYLGHSRGVAMAMILLSSRPEYNSKINLLLGVAPVIYSKKAKCPLYQLAGNRPNAFMRTSTLRDIIENAQLKNVLYTTKNTRNILTTFCRPGAILENLCPYATFWVNGDDFQMFNTTLSPLLISHFTLGVGAKELLHLLQISESDKFRAFDYGTPRNLKIYGSIEPPQFNLSKVQVPTYLYYGPNDFFVSERDLFKLAKELPNFMGSYKVPYPKFNHVDYIFARNANDLLYPHIIAAVNKYNKRQLKV